MQQDAQGNPLIGANSASALAFDAAMACFALYQGDPVGTFDRGLAETPDCAMLWLGKAWLFALATEPGASAMARDFVARAASLPGGAREQAHGTALVQLLRGDWTAAGLTLERWQALAPRDLLALLAGHLIDFFAANARSLRDRVARVLPHWQGVTGESWVMGMSAFGWEEAGDYARAEALGREAVARDPRDSWAHHAVAHVLEMEGRPQDGLTWMAEREAWWAADDDNLQVHNWWHRALCHLELDDVPGALALYDGRVRRGALGFALPLADGAALLWRIEMQGADVGARWVELSEKWQAHESPGYYAFNDMHAAMAHAGAGRFDLAERLLALPPAETEAGIWAHRYGKPLVEGMLAFRKGAHDLAADRLMQARYIANGFGGSHAQRDVIDWTLTESAIRGQNRALAEALSQERLATRPHSPVNQSFLRRAVALPAA